MGHGRVEDVNVLVAPADARGPTAPRRAADGAVEVGPRGLVVAEDGGGAGRPGGGPLRHLYAYAAEDAGWLERQVGRPLPPGALGEDLTLRDVDVTGARVGDRWRVGAALLEVTVPGTHGPALEEALGAPGLAARLRAAARPGAHLVVVEPGAVAAGDEVRVVRERVDHDMTMGALATAHGVDRRQGPALLEQVDQLEPQVASWVRELLADVADRRRRRSDRG